MAYWGDQGFGSYSGRVPSTGEYIGPYDTAEELAAEIEAAEREAAGGAMDPVANLERQRELAAELLDLSDVSEGHRPNGRVIELAFELAELVRALDVCENCGGLSDPSTN